MDLRLGNVKFNKEAFNKASELSGGANALAEKLQVTYQTVLNWKNGRNKTAPQVAIEIERLVNGAVTKQELMPDFPWDTGRAH